MNNHHLISTVNSFYPARSVRAGAPSTGPTGIPRSRDVQAGQEAQKPTDTVVRAQNAELKKRVDFIQAKVNQVKANPKYSPDQKARLVGGLEKELAKYKPKDELSEKDHKNTNDAIRNNLNKNGISAEAPAKPPVGVDGWDGEITAAKAPVDVAAPPPGWRPKGVDGWDGEKSAAKKTPQVKPAAQPPAATPPKGIDGWK